ncbi:MAG: protein-L-isoaspartate(D-aspartate) O-methyltransferase [Flavobacteriaceae bacterium]
MAAGSGNGSDNDPTVARARLVLDLRARGIMDAGVLKAIEQTPRIDFVAPAYAAQAEQDRALPIDCGQTISEPFIVASMTQALRLTGREKVLEIGTGSGYQTAVLARLCRRVYSIERYRSLMQAAEKRLEALRITNVTLMHGDGSQGWPPQAPFDRIIVTAAAAEMPQELAGQLKPGGVMVLPIGPDNEVQRLVRLVMRDDGTLAEETLMHVRFVPLVPGRAIFS